MRHECRTNYLWPDFHRRAGAGRRPLSGGFRQIHQPEQPGEPPLEMLEKGTRREQVLEQLRKEMQQHMKAKTIPLYSLLAEKAQKAAIAFTPKQLIMIMGGVAVWPFLA